jgi:hypothetical protein
VEALVAEGRREVMERSLLPEVVQARYVNVIAMN